MNDSNMSGLCDTSVDIRCCQRLIILEELEGRHEWIRIVQMGQVGSRRFSIGKQSSKDCEKIRCEWGGLTLPAKSRALGQGNGNFEQQLRGRVERAICGVFTSTTDGIVAAIHDV